MSRCDVRGERKFTIDETIKTTSRFSETDEVFRIVRMKTEDITPCRHGHSMIERDGTRRCSGENEFGFWNTKILH
jgi:hypothetical protein